jgi:hypothetical protein
MKSSGDSASGSSGGVTLVKVISLLVCGTWLKNKIALNFTSATLPLNSAVY